MEFSVPVSRIAFGGDGVGRLPDGKVCFVPGALPGETVRAGIVRDAKSFARAELLEVLEASPERRAPVHPARPPHRSASNRRIAAMDRAVFLIFAHLALHGSHHQNAFHPDKVPDRVSILHPAGISVQPRFAWWNHFCRIPAFPIPPL